MRLRLICSLRCALVLLLVAAAVDAQNTPPADLDEYVAWAMMTFEVLGLARRTMEDAFLTFTLWPDGSIDDFTMAAVSPLADFSFDYQVCI
jgi:hypothetical protein